PRTNWAKEFPHGKQRAAKRGAGRRASSVPPARRNYHKLLRAPRPEDVAKSRQRLFPHRLSARRNFRPQRRLEICSAVMMELVLRLFPLWATKHLAQIMKIASAVPPSSVCDRRHKWEEEFCVVFRDARTRSNQSSLPAARAVPK